MSIKVIDYTKLQSINTSFEYDNAVSEIIEASRTSGIFYLTNCGYLCTLTDRSDGLNFYNTSLFNDVVRGDLSLRSSPSNSRGYIVEGGEAGVKESFVERKEGYEYGDDGDTTNNNGGKRNRWPEGAERGRMVRVFDEMEVLKNSLMERVYMEYLNRGRKEEEVVGGNWVWEGGRSIDLIRLFRYLPCEDDEGGRSLGSSPHTDWGLLTLILQEVRSEEREERSNNRILLHHNNWPPSCSSAVQRGDGTAIQGRFWSVE